MSLKTKIWKIALLGADPAKSRAGKVLQLIIAPIILIQVLLMFLALLFQLYLFIFDSGSDSASSTDKTCSVVTSRSGEGIDTCEYLDI